MIAFHVFLSRIASLQLVNVGISEIEVVSSQLDHLADSKTEDKNIFGKISKTLQYRNIRIVYDQPKDLNTIRSYSI